MSALYISLQITLNVLLLPQMEKFLIRFPAFQKLEEVAVVAETPAVVVETIEEVVVAEITPLPSQYEILRANAIAKQEHASQAKLERVLDYTKQTMVAYMSEAELDRLCGYITEYSLGDTPCEVSPVSVDSALKSIDLMHFGWNIGKAFGKSTSTPPHSLRMYLLTPSATSKSQPSNARCHTPNRSAGLSWMGRLGEVASSIQISFYSLFLTYMCLI